MDLSFPLGNSVNSGIRKGYYQGIPFSFTLPTVTTLMDRLVKTGSCSYLWSADLSRAYRQLWVCPRSLPLLGLSVNDKFIWLAHHRLAAERRLSHVQSSGCWRGGGYFALCYLDDFVSVESRATEAYNEFMSICSQLGLALALATNLTWLGSLIDAPSLVVTIAKPKMVVLYECSKWKSK